MATLAGQQIKDKYISLLKTSDNGDLSANSGASAVNITDGIGTATALSLSTDRVGIGKSAPARVLHVVSASDVPQLRLEQSNDANGWWDIHATNAGGHITFARVGTERVRFENGGNVGIGTSVPSHQLEIGNSSGGTFALSRGVSGADVAIGDGSNLGTIYFQGYDASHSAIQIGAKIHAEGAEDWSADDLEHCPGELQFYTQDDTTSDGMASPRMTIDKDGFIGIGISPLSGRQLHIKAQSTDDCIMRLQTASYNSDAVILRNGDGRVDLADGSVSVLPSGNTGIGIAAPATKLHISSNYSAPTGGHDSSTQLIVSNQAAWGGIEILGNTNSGCFIAFGDADDNDIGKIQYSNSTNAFTFITNDATAMTINSTGNVGIGVTPTANMVGLSIEAGCITLKERATPTSDTNYGKIYTKTDNNLYFQDGAGAEHRISLAT